MREAMQQVSCGIYESPIGRLKIFCTQDGVKSVGFQREEAKAERMTESPSPKSEQMLDKTREELKEYFEGKRSTFSVPCVMEGTEFQKKVWKALQEIPYGETRSYQEIAVQIGNPKAYRAVGMANHRNPIAILVPCHRVVGSDGKLTGYAGGLDKKEKLLALEQQMHGKKAI